MSLVGSCFYIAKPDGELCSMIPFEFYTAIYLLNKNIYKLESEGIRIWKFDFFRNAFSVILYGEYVMEAFFFHTGWARTGNVIVYGKTFLFAEVYMNFTCSSSGESMLQSV